MFNSKQLYVVFGLLTAAPFVFAQAQTPAAAPPPAPGTIAGTVYDAQTGRPIVGATISVDGQTDLANVTDTQGTFTLRVAPGDHVLKFVADKYLVVDMNVRGVVSGQVTEASTVMSNTSMVQSIDVTATVDNVTSTAEALLTERRLSAVVSDSIGKQEMSQGAAGDAAGALEKVTGVSVSPQGYVFVRGLGERYSATSLNGAMIPTTEPEKRVVPLDLFPTGMIDSIKVSKTYSPELPAEFSGGLVQLETTEFPSAALFSVSVKGGFNNRTSFSQFLSNPGGGSDYWGFGAGDRQLPAIFTPTRVDRGNYTPAQLEQFGEAMPNVWNPRVLNSMRPAFDWSMNGGGAFGNWGIVGGISFSNRPQFQSEFQRYFAAGVGGAPEVFTEYSDFREYSETARIGGVFNVAYRFNPNHRVVFRNTITRDADKTARQFQGLDGSIGGPIASTRLRYIERDVLASSAGGEHVFADLGSSVLGWQFTFSRSSRDEPDLREIFRTPGLNGQLQYANVSISGLRFFTDMQDRIYEPKVDWSVPFYRGSLVGMIRIGARSTIRRRDFQARRFRYFPIQSIPVSLVGLPSEQLFAPENISPTRFELREFTRGTDAYDATMDVHAGYVMLDLSMGPRWRVVGGLRVEAANQEVVTQNTQLPGLTPVTASLQNTDPTPGVNLIYAFTQQQNLRFSYSRTLSRPDFRELSPFDFNNIQGGFVTVGNANLKRTAIQNFDARWEMFSGGNQLLAASVFYKLFDDPIEQVIIPSADLRQSFVNAEGARNFGLEFEFRRDLTTWHSALREWSISSNFTFVDSNIDLTDEQAIILTSQSRPLLGQSRYVFNGALQWVRPQWNSSARLIANYVSSRISNVGAVGLPDIYQEPNAILDFVYNYTAGERGQWSYRFEAENLTDNHYHWTQGPFTQRLYQLGRTFQIGITYSFF